MNKIKNQLMQLVFIFFLIFFNINTNNANAGIFYDKNDNAIPTLKYFGLSNISISALPSAHSKAPGVLTNISQLDFGILFGNKGSFSISISPMAAFSTYFAKDSTYTNILLFNILSSGRINYATFDNFKIFSEITLITQLERKNYGLSPFTITWHQVGIEFSTYLDKFNKFMFFSSIGFAQYFLMTDSKSFEYINKSVIISNKNNFGIDFRLGGAFTVGAFWNFYNNFSFVMKFVHLLPIPIVENASNYFNNNNLSLFLIGLTALF